MYSGNFIMMGTGIGEVYRYEKTLESELSEEDEGKSSKANLEFSFNVTIPAFSFQGVIKK